MDDRIESEWVIGFARNPQLAIVEHPPQHD
jgi:hypothetical protein